MASCAGDGQPHKSPGDDIDSVIDGVVVVAKLHSDGQEPQCCEARIVLGSVQLVGGNLLDDELVHGQVPFESADHVVTVGVREREARKSDRRTAVRIGIASDIQPVFPPSLGVAR